MKYIKSSFNYIGNKYKLLSQIIPNFPKNINTFIDLFCGGCDVIINVDAKNKIANDIFYPLIKIFQTLQKNDLEYIFSYINDIIKENNLCKLNKQEYISFRDKYNKNPIKNFLDLFILINHSFNGQFEYNKKGEFSCPSGYNRIYFNKTKQCNLKDIHPKLKDIKFINKDFREFDITRLDRYDFVYIDPPYLISTGSYNDGKRGVGIWTEEDELDLYNYLDNLNKNNIKFALSNVISHNGKSNEILKKWIRNYKVIEIKKNYNNSNYQKQNKISKSEEILILNY